ncbi:hypothetical protein ACE1SV_00050 [Streptomyces sp. E-15]
MQQPVAELLRLGSGQFPVQQQDARPGQQIVGREAEFEPDGVDVEVAGGEAAEAGGLAAPDVVLNAGLPAVTVLPGTGRIRPRSMACR